MKIHDPQHQVPEGERTYVRTEVIAKIYDTDPSTVSKWAATGKIPSEKIEGIRRYHLPSVRQKLEGLYRISDDDLELGIFC
jgi:hypothetical protein